MSESEIIISRDATPALFGAVLGMMLSNGMVNRFETPAGGPTVLRLSLATVEEKAASIPAAALDTIQDGEVSEVEAAVREHEAQHLDQVLSLFFDGGELRQQSVDVHRKLLAAASQASSATVDMVETARDDRPDLLLQHSSAETMNLLVDAVRIYVEACGIPPRDGQLYGALVKWTDEHGEGLSDVDH